MLLGVQLTVFEKWFDDGLVPTRRQPIIWTNDGLVYRRKYASLGRSELTTTTTTTKAAQYHLEYIVLPRIRKCDGGKEFYHFVDCGHVEAFTQNSF